MTERAMRARAERERDEAAVATQTAEQRLRQNGGQGCVTTTLA